MEWSRGQAMNLIQLYREKQVLWNQTHPEFKNKGVKNYAWSDISAEMKVGKAEVQAKMKSLIAQFQRETKKVQSVSGKERYRSKWYAFASLQFLKDKTTPRNRRDATIADIKIEENYDEGNPEDHQAHREENQDDSRASKNYTVPEPTNPPRKVAKSKRYSSVTEEAYEAMKNVSGNLIKKNEDEFDVFGRNVAFQIRNLKSKRDRAVAKYKINNILYEMEINQLMPESECESTSVVGTPTSGASWGSP